MKKLIAGAFCFLLFNLNAQERIPEISNSQNSVRKSSPVLNQSETDALEYHNKVRKDVGVSPLTWSTELSSYAKRWADHLAATGCNLKHRSGSDEDGKSYGENIGWSSSSYYDLLDASKAWYSEISEFKNGPLSGDNWYATGHYTQMVWKNTTQVGMGIAKCSNGSTIVVANYNPPGNYMGQQPY